MTGFATNIAEAFEGAIDILDRRGWCQRTGVDAYRQVCAEEALGEACGMPHGWWIDVSSYDDISPRRELTKRSLSFHRARFDQSLFNFNDADGRTPLEVRDRLMACAKLAREEAV